MLGVGRTILRTISRGWRKASGGLNTEVAATLPVLEVLESQIGDAMRKATDATDSLSSSFGDMATRAREVVSQATQAGQEKSNAGVEQVRDVVSVLLTQVRQTNESTEQTADMLSSIENDLLDVEVCMTQIEEIANRSRIVSLNGQIEAARAGSHGQGFAVVATETGDLASSVTETSQRIRKVVDRLTQALKSTCEHTRELVSADHEATRECEERVETMLTGLADYQHNLETNLESTKASSDKLATAISQSVMTLQFQDAVSQRMNHVAETLNEIRDNYGTLVGSTETHAIKRRSDQWFKKLSESYCVDDERLVHSGAAVPEAAQANNSNIELF